MRLIRPNARLAVVLPLTMVAAHALQGAPPEPSQPPPIRPLRYEEDARGYGVGVGGVVDQPRLPQRRLVRAVHPQGALDLHAVGADVVEPGDRGSVAAGAVQAGRQVAQPPVIEPPLRPVQRRVRLRPAGRAMVLLGIGEVVGLRPVLTPLHNGASVVSRSKDP